MARNTDDKADSIGLEAKRWAAAEGPSGPTDPLEREPTLRGLSFSRCRSAAVEGRPPELHANDDRGLLEDRDGCTAEGLSRGLGPARGSALQAPAKVPTNVKALDDRQDAIEANHPGLAAALPKVHQRPAHGEHSLGERIDLTSGIGFATSAQRAKHPACRGHEHLPRHIWGRVEVRTEPWLRCVPTSSAEGSSHAALDDALLTRPRSGARRVPGAPAEAAVAEAS
jgi:hypothetical protein